MLPRSLVRLAVCLFPLLAGVCALWLIEASELEPSTPSARLAKSPPTRLVVFWIDSLARAEAEDAELMPALHARLARSAALHGAVQACSDAVTVPCFTAMITGVDRFSVFALGKNFGSQSGVVQGSVLGALQRQGKRIGYLGEPMVESTLHGLDALSVAPDAADGETIKRGLALLDSEQLDVAIIHMHETDELAHRVGALSPRYKRALRAVDSAIDDAIAELQPSDHFVILGDHGHTTEGRHFAGLEVPTYAAYFGPRFARTLERPFAITDHGALWGQLFGLQFGARSWVNDYFEGRTLAAVRDLPALPVGEPMPLWAALLCGLLGLTTAATALRSSSIFVCDARALRALLGLFVVALLSGAGWLFVRPYLSHVPLWRCVLVALFTGLLGAWSLRDMVRSRQAGRQRSHLYELAFVGALCLALPTVYKYGGAFVALTWLGVGVIGLLYRALRAGQGLRALGLLVICASLFSIYNPAVRNFALRWFPVYSETLAEHNLLACSIWLAAALAFAQRRAGFEQARVWIGAAAGVALAALHSVLPALAYVLPCALALPLPSLGLLLARTAVGESFFRVLPAALALIRLRVGLLLAFMAAFFLQSPEAGPFITADIVQELVLWLLCSSLLSLLPQQEALTSLARDSDGDIGRLTQAPSPSLV